MVGCAIEHRPVFLGIFETPTPFLHLIFGYLGQIFGFISGNQYLTGYRFVAYTRFLPIYLIETGVIDKDQFIESLFRLAKSFDADEEEEVKQGLLNIAQRIADTYSGKSEPRWRPEVIMGGRSAEEDEDSE